MSPNASETVMRSTSVQNVRLGILIYQAKKYGFIFVSSNMFVRFAIGTSLNVLIGWHPIIVIPNDNQTGYLSYAQNNLLQRQQP